MKILYGVAGEGLGHATRAAAVIALLAARGHAVRVLAAGRAYDALRARLPDVVPIAGLALHWGPTGALDLGATVARNAAALPALLARNAAAWRDAERWAPGAVVTDFEPTAATFGRAHGLPVVAIDNLWTIACAALDPALVAAWPGQVALYRAAIVAQVGLADRHVVPTFFRPALRPDCAAPTAFVPPIVRADVQRARPTDAGHVLVYQSAAPAPGLLAALRAVPRARFVVYGLAGEGTAGNVTLRAPSDAGFLADLASAHAVVASAGASLLGEALCLGKPVLAVPLPNHFEQAMNAHYLAARGYGATVPVLDAAALAAFLRAAPGHAARLATAPVCDGNARLGALLGAWFGAAPTRPGARRGDAPAGGW